MKIGIDIDDTISSTFEIIFPYAQKFDIEELGNKGNVQNYGKIENHHYIESMYPHWKREELELFWTKYFKKAILEAETKPYAVEIIQKLQEEGNEIFLVTSRYEENNFETEKSTKKWLTEHHIDTNHLLMNIQDKGKICKELQLDVLIDDSIHHCKSAQKVGTRAFLMTSIMNQGVEVPELERVYSWIQIYDKL